MWRWGISETDTGYGAIIRPILSTERDERRTDPIQAGVFKVVQCVGAFSSETVEQQEVTPDVVREIEETLTTPVSTTTTPTSTTETNVSDTTTETTTSSTTQTNTSDTSSQQTTGQSDPPSNNNDSGGSGSEGSGGGYGY